uniref:Uncharacterized protein n=1 Tax=Romanomermis culicivorax TaxID=13658 RepID=A0A915JXM2_ROMCU
MTMMMKMNSTKLIHCTVLMKKKFTNQY